MDDEKKLDNCLYLVYHVFNRFNKGDMQMSFDAGLAVKKAMAEKEVKQVWVAQQMGITRGRMSQITNSMGDSVNVTTVIRLAIVFNMELSEFIALGSK